MPDINMKYKIPRKNNEFIVDKFRFTIWIKDGIEIEEFDDNHDFVKRIIIPHKIFEKLTSKLYNSEV